MILSEKINSQESTPSYNGNDTSFMYEAIMEANDAYYDLCMKMVKCEHTSIVNEDTEMLALAESEFTTKVRAIAEKALAKFLAFIDRVRAEWSKLVAGVISKFVDPVVAREMQKAADFEKIEVEVEDGNMNEILGMFHELAKMDPSDLEKLSRNYAEAKEKLDGYEQKSSYAKRRVTSQMVGKAILFLEKRKDMIKLLEAIKSNGKKAAALDSKISGQAADSLAISKFSSLVSKIIVRVNKQTINAVKICRACYGKKTKEMKENIKNQKLVDSKLQQTKRANEKAAAEANAQESVLDLFA
jgi:hypothetical protein